MALRNTLRREIIYELEFLQSIGRKLFLYPFINKKTSKITGYFLIHILVFCTAIQLILTLLSNTTDWLEIINVAPNLGVVLMTMIKYMKFHTHRNLYNKIFNHFRDDMWDIVDTNCLVHRRIIKKYKWISMCINRFLLYYSIPLIVIVDSFPYIVMWYEEKFMGTNEYLYPFDGWYPFDKIKWYAAAYIWESCMTAVVVFVFVFSNMIHASYITFICMELRIIGDKLENLISPEKSANVYKNLEIDDTHRRLLESFKILIDKHNFLTKTSAKLDAALGDAMLLNYSLGAIFICLTAFTFTVVDNLYKCIRYFFMFTALVLEIFNQCLIGQILSDHSIKLTESVYFCNWPCTTPEVKKNMLMLMMRTQKPFVLTANGYLVMNMNTFSRICSISYQLFNLLRTMYL